jgi:uncharacterized protein
MDVWNKCLAVLWRGWVGIGMITLLAATGGAAPSGDLSLLRAVRDGDTATVRSLIEQHADVNGAAADGQTPLAWAAYRNDLETVTLLVRAGADVNTSNGYGVTPLALACSNANARIVAMLLAAGANPNAAQMTGETALMTCARTGSQEAVQSLLERGAEANARENQRGQTALMWAAAEKHFEVVRTLVNHGADVNARSSVSELPSPFRAVTYTQDVHFPTKAGGYTPLLFAARSGDLESARILLDAGAKINDVPAADGIGDGSALVLATASGHEAFAQFLVERGANPNAADGYGITALHWALAEGIRALVGGGSKATDRFWFHSNMPGLVKTLLAHGADPNVRITKDFPPYDNEIFGHTLGNNLPQITLVGATPFLLASAVGEVGMMRLLVEARGDSKLTTVDRTTPLLIAAGVGRERENYSEEDQKRFLESVKLTLLLGGDVNATNAQGRTALHAAVYMGAAEVIQLLAEKGANLNAKDMYGQTPVSIALGDPEGLVYRQLPGDAFDYRFRQPKEQKKIAELLVSLGAAPFTGKYRDRSGE